MNIHFSIHGALLALCILFNSTERDGRSLQTETMSAFNLIVSYPVVMQYGIKVQLTNFCDTILIVQYKDFTLYRLAPRRIFETDAKIPGTEPYFVRKGSEPNGKLFTTLNDTSYQLVPADSLLRRKAFSTAYFELSSNDRLIKTRTLNGVVEEQYVPIKKMNETVFDTIRFCFSSALNVIPYSFSPKLDSIRNSKLFKVELIYNKYYSSNYHVTMPKRIFLFELGSTSIEHPEQLMRLFELEK